MANVLIVDDISRTGESVEKAAGYIKNMLFAENIFVCVLVVCGRKKDPNVDYNPYWTQSKDVQLPWSSEERKREARRNIRENMNLDETVTRVGDQDSLNTRVHILRMADAETKEGEEIDIVNEDIESVIHLIENAFPTSDTI